MDNLRLPLGAFGVWLREAVLCGCGFIYALPLKECPKCSSDQGVNLMKLIDRLLKVEERKHERQG
jgi:hypothetical protein